MNAFDYFKKITTIPRGSYNEKEIAQFVFEWGKSKNLVCKMDDMHNVYLYKDNKSKNNIIVQAHLDMVCAKTTDYDFDFKKQKIDYIINDDYISAHNTSLGADDGFGIALIMSILDKNNDNYPNIEAIFTVQEEVGMNGAKYFDCTQIKSKYMIGLDGTSSDEIIISCAGSTRLSFNKKLKKIKLDSIPTYYLSISNLIGGHSGEDINKKRANAIKCAMSLLHNIDDLYFGNIICGEKENVIPTNSEIIFATSDKNTIQKINTNLFKIQQQFPEENICIKIETINTINNIFVKANDIINFIELFPNGILEQTNSGINCSNNLAIISLENANININSMLRYNDYKLDKYYMNTLQTLADKFDFKVTILSKTPFFTNSLNSKFVQLCVESYKELGYECKCNTIHAGVEVGIFSNKIPALQSFVLGADLYNIHSNNEKMKISSLDKIYSIIDKFLTKFNSSNL